MCTIWNISHQCQAEICHRVRVPSALVTFFRYFNVLTTLLFTHITQVLWKLTHKCQVSAVWKPRFSRLFCQIQISDQIIQFRLPKQRERPSQSAPNGSNRSVSLSSPVEAGELRASTSISGSSVNKRAGISSQCATGCLADGIWYCRPKCCLV